MIHLVPLCGTNFQNSVVWSTVVIVLVRGMRGQWRAEGPRLRWPKKTDYPHMQIGKVWVYRLLFCVYVCLYGY